MVDPLAYVQLWDSPVTAVAGVVMARSVIIWLVATVAPEKPTWLTVVAAAPALPDDPPSLVRPL